MNVFGRVAKGVFGRPSGYAQQEDESVVEGLLHQISEGRHAEDRRDAMAQLRDLLQDSSSAQLSMGTMGIPVMLSVLQEDRDDIELVKGALEVLYLSMAMPDTAAAGKAGEQQPECSPPPALINADLYCRAPDNVLLLLGLLRDGPEGIDDLYVRYTALQAMGALLAACPDKFQACVLSSPLGVVALMDLLSSPMEVLRNEALVLLVGLCSGCVEIAGIVAFEGGFEKLLGICKAEGGPSGGGVVLQDATELMNNLLRGNLANQRLFREMGHITQLPPLLQFTPPASPAASTAGMLLGTASQYMDPTLKKAAGAAAAAAANTPLGAAAAGAAGAPAAWPAQVAANYLCLLETARLLLAAPHSSSNEQQAQEEANKRANQDRLGELGLLALLSVVAIDGVGAPSAAVRAQALFCLGDLIHGHPQLQEQLAGTLVSPPDAPPAALLQQQQQQPYGQVPPSFFPGSNNRPLQQQQQQQEQPVSLLLAALRLVLRGVIKLERAGARHLLEAFCHSNTIGQLALLSTIAPSAEPHTFGEELCAALLCQSTSSTAAAAYPAPPAGIPYAGFDRSITRNTAGSRPGTPAVPNPYGRPPVSSSDSPEAMAASQLYLQLCAGRAARILGYLLQQNPAGQSRLLGLQVSDTLGDTLLLRTVKVLAEGCRRADKQALPACYCILRLLITWCWGCTAAVSSLLAVPSHLPLLVDLVGSRMPASDVHTAGLTAVLLGVCLMFAPGSPVSRQHQLQQDHQQQQQQSFAAAGRVSYSQLLDVLLNRTGLSQLFGAIDDMKGSKAYAAVMTAPQLPAHITRAAAAAVLQLEAHERAGESGNVPGLVGGSNSSSISGGWSLLTGALIAAAGPSILGTAAGSSGQDPNVQPYDYSFMQLVDEVGNTVQQLALHVFAGGASTTKTNVTTGIDDLQLQPQLQQQDQHMQQQQLNSIGPQQQQHPDALAAVAAQLPGDTADSKLGSALLLILQLQSTCEELRFCNRSLAEDLIRLSSSKSRSNEAAGAQKLPNGTSVANGATAANGSPLPAAAANGSRGLQGGMGSGPASTSGLMDMDDRMAAQLRASRAEMEAGALRQQLATMQQQWTVIESQAAAAHEEAEQAQAAAAKAEADLASLSTAYNSLEAHAFELEERLRQQQQPQGGVGESNPGSGGAADADGCSGVSESELQARIAAAAAGARVAAEAEAGEEMEDLLACLGEEQGKVEVLSTRLTELGEDVDKLLQGAAAAAEEDDNDDKGEGGSDALL